MTAGAVHSSGLAARWHSMPLSEQMGNIGSEVERAIRAHTAGRSARFEAASTRALELFDLTAQDERWRGHRRREILRARSEFCTLFWDESVSPESAAGLGRYFLQFAVLSRSGNAV